MLPLVYVETNWLIALLFPHDERHEAAMDLLARGNRNECELRIPRIAFVEARITMGNVGSEFSKELARLKDKLSRGHRAGWEVFHAGLHGLGTSGLELYTQRDMNILLEALDMNPDIHAFSHAEDEVVAMGTLWREIGLAKKDVKDFYILASVVVDRAKQNPKRSAIFMSSNDKEFDPSKQKVPLSFYERNRLVYRKTFADLNTAVGNWKGQFP